MKYVLQLNKVSITRGRGLRWKTRDCSRCAFIFARENVIFLAVVISPTIAIYAEAIRSIFENENCLVRKCSETRAHCERV